MATTRSTVAKLIWGVRRGWHTLVESDLDSVSYSPRTARSLLWAADHRADPELQQPLSGRCEGTLVLPRKLQHDVRIAAEIGGSVIAQGEYGRDLVVG